MKTTKYIDKVKIHNHYTNYKGRLFIKILCDLFTSAAEAQTELYGVDVTSLNKEGMTWMLHRQHIELSKVPLQGEEVYIETWPSGIDRLFALRDCRMIRESGEELVRASSEWMYIDLNRRRPMRQSEEVVKMSTEHDIPHLELTSILNEKEFQLSEIQGKRQFEATFDNIDFNGHVTQASYVRWITNSLSFEFLKEHLLVEIEVIYAHEIMPDSTIFSNYSIEEKSEDRLVIHHQLCNESESVNHCIAKTVWERYDV